MRFLKGDGKFAADIVGESFHQAELAALTGPKKENGYRVPYLAVMAMEVDNPSDPNAVSITLADAEADRAAKVGFLSREDAKEFRHFMKELGVVASDVILCRALIVGGWRNELEVWDDDDLDDFAEPKIEISEGFYGVKLDLQWPFEIDPVYPDIGK